MDVGLDLLGLLGKEASLAAPEKGDGGRVEDEHVDR
jgi:hypothetical protein